MRSNKSSTLIKKSQSFMKSKIDHQPINIATNYSHRASNTLKVINDLQKIKNNQNNVNKINKSETKNFYRTYSKKNQDSLYSKRLNKKQIQSKNTVSIKRNHNENQTKILNEKSINIGSKIKQRIVRTHIMNIANNNSVVKQSIKKNKIISIINPEQNKLKRSKILNNNYQINTRKSKYESEVKKKQINQKQRQKLNYERLKQKIFITPLKKSKNLNIKTIKGINKNNQNIEMKQQTQKQIPLNKYEQQKQQDNIQNLSQINNNNLSDQKKSQIIVNKSLTRKQQTQNKSFQFIEESSLSIINQNQRSNLQYQPLIQNIQSSTNFNIIQSQRQRIQLSSGHSQNQRHQIHQNNSLNQRNLPNQNRINQRLPPQNNRQSQRAFDLRALIANTQDIINFINRLNLRNRAQPFDLMVAQLTQLNLIANQVQQLGQIGNNLGYSLVNIFGTRIRQLQTTIINQVGQALILSFQQRIDPQFQALVIRQPSLRQGFSKIQIQKIFEQKLTFQQVECSICLDNVKQGQKIIQLQCFHQYHPICIKTWLQNSKKCPLCRKQQIKNSL